MDRPIAIAVVSTLAAVVAGGCGGKQEHVVTYAPPVEMGELAAGLNAPSNSYALVTDQTTEGRFACALAIARLGAAVDGDNQAALVVPTQPNEQAFWSEQMRGIPAIRELVFLSPRSTRADGPSAPDICNAAQRVGAALLLIYATNTLGPNSAEVLGALYDTKSRTVLATLHASATFIGAEGQQESPDPLEGDHRDEDARYQAQRKFEGYALACLRDLMQRDHKPTATQPHDAWLKPFNERWWIPRHW